MLAPQHGRWNFFLPHTCMWYPPPHIENCLLMLGPAIKLVELLLNFVFITFLPFHLVI